MKKHTTFGIGGYADIFILPNKNSQISDIIKLIKENNVKYYFLGSGSNILTKAARARMSVRTE